METSIEQPFRGWNEGINTSAPLSYLLGTYFRQLPSNERKCLDVIPVDMVCRGMTLIAAALVERRHKPLYQLATSANNPCDMGRSIELTALAHRKHYRAQQGLEHWVRMRFDTIPVSKERYRNLSVPAQKFVVQGINRAASALQFKRPPLARAERDLERVEKLIELYEPFILHNEQVFESENVQLLSALLPVEEREQFGYEPGADRLVGLLDQYPRPGAAQMVLSADRRPRRGMRAAPRIPLARSATQRQPRDSASA